MGWLILIVVVLVGGYVLYGYISSSGSIDDREDGSWFTFTKQSGPFHWRKKWMSYEPKPYDTIKKEYDEIKFKASVQEAVKDIDVDEFLAHDEFKDWEDATLNDGLENNIRVKQKSDDWEYVLPHAKVDYRIKHSMTRSREVVLLNKIIKDIDRRLKDLENG